MSKLHTVIISVFSWFTLGKSFFKIGICLFMASLRWRITLLLNHLLQISVHCIQAPLLFCWTQ
jgi:hypothetical protein